jgi:hypothetical protein
MSTVTYHLPTEAAPFSEFHEVRSSDGNRMLVRAYDHRVNRIEAFRASP